MPLFCMIDKEERTRGPAGRILQEREGVWVKRRMGTKRNWGPVRWGQEGGGKLFALPRRSLCLVPRGPLQALSQAGGGQRNPLTWPISTEVPCQFQGCHVASSAPLVPGPGSPESPERRAGHGARQPAMTCGNGYAQAVPWAARVARSSRCPLMRRRPRCWAPRTWTT